MQLLTDVARVPGTFYSLYATFLHMLSFSCLVPCCLKVGAGPPCTSYGPGDHRNKNDGWRGLSAESDPFQQ